MNNLSFFFPVCVTWWTDTDFERKDATVLPWGLVEVIWGMESSVAAHRLEM